MSRAKRPRGSSLSVRSATLDGLNEVRQTVCMFESEIAPVRDRLIAAGVKRLGLFGSYARGEAKPNSDVDVFVVFEPRQKTYQNFCAVGDALEEVFRRKVELVTDKALSPYLGPKIMREVKYVDLNA